jgi:DtxR family Mn-dependent transcriptional regulator
MPNTQRPDPTARTGLSQSLEDYLEAILDLHEAEPRIRVTDIASRLALSKASVTGALRQLAKRGLVDYAPYGTIGLTPEGIRVARDIARRHNALQAFFIDILGVNPAQAEKQACALEHSLSLDVMRRLHRFVERMTGCPRCGVRDLQKLGSCDLQDSRDCAGCPAWGVSNSSLSS